MRLALFTDTLGDVNGVSRFVRNLADEASRRNESLRVYSSTRFPVPSGDSFRNFAPLFAFPMPGYPMLDLSAPPPLAISRDARAWRPDAVHVSTPGPVGLLGRWLAARLRVPLLGTYHTDFPAYLERIFGDAVLGNAAAAYMRWFYRPFRTVIVRSNAYLGPLGAVGIEPPRVATLRAGTDLDAFHPRNRDPGLWQRLGIDDPGVAVLCCGRVSVEKNLPMLARAWHLADRALRQESRPATLIVVGDGPYLAQCREDLSGTRSAFLGFRHGTELASIIASSDLLAFPSHTDTLGQVVMEAQASGIPALVSDVGGPQSMVIHGTTGLIVSSTGATDEQPHVWAQAIARLVREDDTRRRMGAAAHTHLQSFGFHDSFSAFWKIHQDTLE